MPPPPGLELFLLQQAAEDDLPLGRWQNFQWQSSAHGRSPFIDAVVFCEGRGWVEIAQESDDDGSGRLLARARLTSQGKLRLAELRGQGVAPEDPGLPAAGSPP